MEITLDKFQYKSRFIFIRQKLLRVKICIYQIYMTKKACAPVIIISMPVVRSIINLNRRFYNFQSDFERKPFICSKGIFSRKIAAGF